MRKFIPLVLVVWLALFASCLSVKDSPVAQDGKADEAPSQAAPDHVEFDDESTEKVTSDQATPSQVAPNQGEVSGESSSQTAPSQVAASGASPSQATPSQPTASQAARAAASRATRDGDIRWYRSNLSGLTLELIPSRIVALRNEYCVSVERFPPYEFFDLFPPILRPYYNELYSAERRVLYENGIAQRRQWIFRDANGSTRVTASGNDSFFSGRRPVDNGEPPSGLIEIRNEEHYVTRELRYEEDYSEWEYRFSYTDKLLAKAEIRFKEDEDFVLLYTDNYRYTRSGSLRAVERTVHETAGSLSRIIFPRLGPGADMSMAFATRGIAFTSDFLLDIHTSSTATISYALDDRGRIDGEVWKDEDGKTVGEFFYTWSGNRLQSVSWKALNDERRVEYEYDGKGNRIVERNYRQGVLERSIVNREGIDLEEIFLDGRLVLRTYWDKGVKISEERFLSGANR